MTLDFMLQILHKTDLFLIYNTNKCSSFLQVTKKLTDHSTFYTKLLIYETYPLYFYN
jgi:hypothetical protein